LAEINFLPQFMHVFERHLLRTLTDSLAILRSPQLPSLRPGKVPDMTYIKARSLSPKSLPIQSS